MAMLEMRPICENCGKKLPNESAEAMICTYECTFCTKCVTDILKNVCPNCNGGFEKRPTRPKNGIRKHPVTDKEVYKPVDIEKYKSIQDKFIDTDPRER